MQARVDDLKHIQFEVFHRDAHAWRQFTCIAAFEFHADALLVFEQQQIKLRTLVGGPKIRLTGLRYSPHLLKAKPSQLEPHSGLETPSDWAGSAAFQI